MKLITILLAIVSLPLNSFAQNSAFWNVNSQHHSVAVPAIRIVEPAEVLAADVTIVATNHNSSEQAIAFSNTLGLFRAEVSRTSNVSIKRERTEQGGGDP